MESCQKLESANPAGLICVFVSIGFIQLRFFLFYSSEKIPFLSLGLLNKREKGGGPVTQKVYKRKLIGILSADVEGYSSLMGEDEEATVYTLESYRKLMHDVIVQHRGRLVDTHGDNLLAEFASVVEAVQCAVEIQQVLGVKNAELTENCRMNFRIGVNLGDVIEENEKIYGEGVNIAARIEKLAEAGGISISGIAFDQVKNKLNLKYKYIGEHTVKNIADPIKVYRILMKPECPGKLIGENIIRSKRKNWLALSCGILLILGVGAAEIYNLIFGLPQVSIAAEKEMSINLPEGLSIAVLPFNNISNDPPQEYFSDGLTENIINGLSACSKIMVIARNSSFAYKGKPLNVSTVAEALGVQYILEGDIEKSTHRVRISVKLIDASQGHAIWAEKYDRELKDIFILQDEIILNVLTALEVKLTEGEYARVKRKGPYSLEAFIKGLQALQYIRLPNMEDNIKARKMIREVLKLVPEFSEGYLLLAMTYLKDFWFSSNNSFITFAQTSRYLKKAIKLNKNNSEAYTLLCYLQMIKGNYERAITAGMAAVDLNPNGADALNQLANALHKADRSAEAIDVFKKAIDLNPIPPSYYFCNLGNAYGSIGQYKNAITEFKKAIGIKPTDVYAHIGLAVTYSIIGRIKEAEDEVNKILKINPEFSLKDLYRVSPIKNHAWLDSGYNSGRTAILSKYKSIKRTTN